MPESDTLTRELFATLVQKLLTSYSTVRWLFDSDSFSLLCGTGDDQASLPLSMLYHSYSVTASPANLLELQRQLRALLTPPAEPRPDGDPLSSLLPCMRTYVHFQGENFRARPRVPVKTGEVSTEDLLFFPYADVLGVGLVLNNGDKVQPIRYVELDQLGLSAEEAVDIAVGNLHHISTEPFRLVQAGFYTSPWKDQYDGARLLLTDLFSNLKVDGEVVALTPTPGTLLVTGSKDIIGIELMMSIGTTLIKEPNAVLALPLVLRDGLWTSFTVPIDDPIFDTINSYRMHILKVLYAEQEILIAPSKKDKYKVLVSPFVVDNDQSRGYPFGKTSAFAGNVSSIPDCDIIEFFQESKTGKKDCVARAPLSKVAELLPSHFLKRDPVLRPARWRLNNFPRPIELEKLGLMPPGCGLWSSPDRAAPDQTEGDLEALVRIPIPNGARLTFTADAKNKETTLEFAVNNSIDELKVFYQAKFKIGSSIVVPTELGLFTISEAIGAACTREAWFGPGKIEGETLLRLIKRVNFNTPSVQNAFIKQSESLRAFEQLFGVSLLQNMQPQDELEISKENALQYFVTPDPPDTVLQFFRIQMSGPRTIYIAADKENPHTVINMDAGLIVTIDADKPRDEDTLFSVSRSLE